jgi:hypothetical protein
MAFPFIENPEWDFGGFAASLDVPGGGLPSPTVTFPEVRLPPITIGGGGSARKTAVHIVNYFEPVFADNRDRFRAGMLSASEAEQNFQSLWRDMTSRLAQLGGEGQRAIADRQPGGKFDWWAAYGRFPTGGFTPLTPSPQPTFPGDPTFTQPPIVTQQQGLSVGGLLLLGGLGYLLFR